MRALQLLLVGVPDSCINHRTEGIAVLFRYQIVQYIIYFEGMLNGLRKEDAFLQTQIVCLRNFIYKSGYRGSLRIYKMLKSFVYLHFLLKSLISFREINE